MANSSRNRATYVIQGKDSRGTHKNIEIKCSAVESGILPSPNKEMIKTDDCTSAHRSYLYHPELPFVRQKELIGGKLIYKNLLLFIRLCSFTFCLMRRLSSINTSLPTTYTVTHDIRNPTEFEPVPTIIVPI